MGKQNQKHGKLLVMKIYNRNTKEMLQMGNQMEKEVLLTPMVELLKGNGETGKNGTLHTSTKTE